MNLSFIAIRLTSLSFLGAAITRFSLITIKLMRFCKWRFVSLSVSGSRAHVLSSRWSHVSSRHDTKIRYGRVCFYKPLFGLDAIVREFNMKRWLMFAIRYRAMCCQVWVFVLSRFSISQVSLFFIRLIIENIRCVPSWSELRLYTPRGQDRRGKIARRGRRAKQRHPYRCRTVSTPDIDRHLTERRFFRTCSPQNRNLVARA